MLLGVDVGGTFTDAVLVGDGRVVTAKAPTTPADNTQVMLEYTNDRKITINHQPVTMQDLESRLRDIFETRAVKTMFIAGDGGLRYGEIIAVIDAAKGAGVEKVGIVTEEMRRGGQPKTGN